MHNHAKWLGFAGLIPFVGIPILVLSGYLHYFQGYTYFVQYSAIILSFFGGIHWLDALQNRRTNHQLYVSMLPSVVGFVALVFLDGYVLLSILSIAYIGILMYDKYVLALDRDILIPYTYMRIWLTTIVVLSHLFMASI